MSAVFVISTDEDALKAVFAQLAVDVDQAHFQNLRPMPFGTYGQFYDKYGRQWIFPRDVKPRWQSVVTWEEEQA